MVHSNTTTKNNSNATSAACSYLAAVDNAAQQHVTQMRLQQLMRVLPCIFSCPLVSSLSDVSSFCLPACLLASLLPPLPLLLSPLQLLSGAAGEEEASQGGGGAAAAVQSCFKARAAAHAAKQPKLPRKGERNILVSS